MSFKTILAVTAPTFDPEDIDRAASLAEEAGAHLSVLLLGIASPPPTMAEPMIPSLWLAEREEELEATRAKAAALRERLAARGISYEVKWDYPYLSEADDVIARHGRYADVTLLGRSAGRDPDFRRKVYDGALFSSSRPLLVTPEDGRSTLAPQSLVIAWNARPEAARAVREALPMAIAAEEVIIAVVDPIEADTHHGADPGADLATYLARHGARVTVKQIRTRDETVAEALGLFSNGIGADLLVMGAYGHSRLRERIFGGTTRDLLERPPLPLFLAR